MFRLDGKSAIVTGGGSGIGREISLLFAKQGAVVAVADVNTDGAATVAKEITDAGGNAFAQRLDVASQDSANEAVVETVRRHGKLDILVNNAGIGFVGNVLETGDEDLDKLYAVNVKGVLHCSKAAITQMLTQDPKDGRIVNIGSVAGMVSVARRFAYCATKGAVLSMTQSLAMDFIDQGIPRHAVRSIGIGIQWAICRLCGVQLRLDLGQLLPDLRERSTYVGPVESH